VSGSDFPQRPNCGYREETDSEVRNEGARVVEEAGMRGVETPLQPNKVPQTGHRS